MAHRRLQFRVLLPVFFGLVSGGLIAWATHEDVACVGHDAGKPFWPCDAPRVLFNFLSAPCIALFQVLFRWWNAGGIVWYLAQWPFVLLWWWFVGTRLDFGLLGMGRYRWRKTWIGVLLGFLIVLLALAFGVLRADYLRFRRYPELGSPLTVSTGMILGWLLSLAGACGLAVVRLWRGETGRQSQPLVTPPALRWALACCFVYSILMAALNWNLRAQERRLRADFERHQSFVQGRILDETGVPVEGIEVQLVPTFKEGDARWAGTARAWTDEHGDYKLIPEQTGEYLLGAMLDEGPFAEQPFLSTYYPGTSDAANAAKIKLRDEQHLLVEPMHLRRLPLVRVPVTVVWADGRPEPTASILFQNPLFPHEAGIGSASVVPEGDGRVPLPAGYDYFAVASVQCDAGTRIESRETARVPLSTKAGTDLSRQIRLTLSGPMCKLWQPN